ncbi:MAG TPA: metalloregulator ArsR/SmtB family transcription factor [Methanomassiliicoccales archaeon]|jgi:ArsR family transcriptional regulator
MNLPKEMEEALNERGGLEGLRKLVPDQENLTSEAERFQAVSDPIRLQILHALLVIDLCPCILKEITELSDSRLSYHLNILEQAKLITSSPRKKWRIYMLTEMGKSLIAF